VEFAILLPFVAALAGIVVAVTALCIETLALNDLARNCARAAAVSADPVSTATGLARDSGRRVSVSVRVESGLVTVTLRRSIIVHVPFLGRVSLRTPVGASAVMLTEPPFPGVPADR
jgi:hypothetical protein